MGSYGFGVTRVLAALAEKNRDDVGLMWPVSVAPYHIHVVATGRDSAIFDTAAKLSEQLSQAGLEVLYDDRPKVSPGVKFADSEILGVPFILIVGRGLTRGVVEVRERATGEQQEMEPENAVSHLSETVRSALEHLG